MMIVFLFVLICLLILQSEFFVRRYSMQNSYIVTMWGVLGGVWAAFGPGEFNTDELRWEYAAYWILGYIGLTLLGVAYSWLRGWDISWIVKKK